MYVKNIDAGIKCIPLFFLKNRTIYLFVYHPELTLFQNIRLNFLEGVREK